MRPDHEPFRFSDSDRARIIAALIEVDPSIESRAAGIIPEIEAAISRYRFSESSRLERPSEARRSLVSRLRSRKPLHSILQSLRPQERAWLRMAIASAQLRGQDANDKDALVHALQSMGVQRYDSMGLDLLIVELCHLFNEATGKTPTQWRDWRTNEERSNAGPFIHAVTESAGIAITPSRIRAAVESWRRVQILLSVPV